MKLPPFIVTLGTWQIVLTPRTILYSRNETIRSQDIEAQAPLLQIFGPQIRIGGAVFTFGVIFMVLLVLRALVHPEPHRLGATRLRGRRRSGRRRALRRRRSSAC